MMYQSVYRPGLRPDENLKWSIIFKNLFSDFKSLVEANYLSLNVPFIYQDNYITLLLLKTHLSFLNTYSLNSATLVHIPLDKSVVSFPKAILP